MKAMIVREFGGLDKLKLENRADPVPAADEVVITVRACGVNFADSLMIAGQYQVKPPLPFSPGLEVAGEISAIGANVTGWALGDRVQALSGWGGFAEKTVAPAALLTRIPAHISFQDAAALVITYGTAHLGLYYRGRLKAGEWLVVNGAGGGVGLTAVEIGNLLGARVIASAGSAEKLALARDRGASHLINYREDNLRDRIREITGGVGADMVYDPVGGDIFQQSFRALAPEGRMMVIGFASGDVPQIPANHLLVKNIEVIGFYWGAYKTFRTTLLKDSIQQIFAWHAAGKICPHIGGTFPLEQTAEAIQALKDRKASGKLVVVMD